MLSSLTNKTALITGGSRGIGQAIAHRLSREGARCILIGRNEASLKAACSALPLAQGHPNHHQHVALPGEVGQPETWDAIAAWLSRENIGVDVLVNAAGVSQASLLVKTDTLEVDKILDTNLRSAVLGCRVVGRLMMKRARAERPGCSIINVSSVMAMRGGVGASVYAASKAGILGLTSALSQELGQFQIRVNALVPGYIETQMIENLDKTKLSKQIPLGRVGRAEEVADAAAFLATNSYANNCVLTIDGGLNAAFS